MAARVVPYEHPIRGLNYVSRPAKVFPGQLQDARNCVYLRTSIRRRRGRRAAYRWLTTDLSEITLIKRFYKLRTSGDVDKYTFLVHSTATQAFYMVGTLAAPAEWDDDTATLIETFETFETPNTGDNTLYFRDSDGYPTSTATISFTEGYVRRAFLSNGWCYFVTNFDDTDDILRINNVPFRTRAEAEGVALNDPGSFLHGLVPPNAINPDYTDDVNSIGSPDIETVQEIQSNQTPIGDTHSVAIDSNDTIHSIYMADFPLATGFLQYSYRPKNGAWSASETISSNDPGYGAMGIAVDKNNRVHVCFYDATNKELRYVRQDNTGAWDEEVVDSVAADVGTQCRIAIDYLGYPHIVYRDVTNNQIKWATLQGAAWTIEVINALGTPEWPSVVIGPDNTPAVAWVETAANINYFSYRTGVGAWLARETIDNANSPSATAMTVDSLGLVQVSYANSTGTAILWAQRSAAIGTTPGAWAPQAINPTDGVGPTSIALDPITGRPAVVYRTGTGQYLAYAERRNTLAVWDETQVVEYTGSTNTPLVTHAGSLAFDSEGDPKIAYDWSGIQIPTAARMALNGLNAYWYKLTFEYDDLILGESGPSAAARVRLENKIDKNVGNTILMLAASTNSRYWGTNDCTRINIYRTFRNAAETSLYRKVGSVDLGTAGGSVGSPLNNFEDEVTDLDLAANAVLDEDKFLPPKYRYAVMWKDRLVIGNLKARDTLDDTSLDWGESADACVRKNRIRFSKAFQPDIFPSLFFQDLLPDGESGEIKGLTVNSQRDTLVVHMEHDVVELRAPIFDINSGSLSAPYQNVVGAHGTPSPESIVEYEGYIFYWTKWGIEVMQGTRARNISADTIGNLWNMRETAHPNYDDRINMDEISRVTGVLHVDEDGEKILWAYPSGSRAYNDRILVLDFSRWRDLGFQDDGVFSIWTGWSIGCFETWDGEGDKNELFGGNGDDTTRAWSYRLRFGDRDEVGSSSDNTVDATNPVDPMTVYYRPHNAGAPHRLKRFRVARLFARGDAVNVVMTFATDERNPTTAVDDFTWTNGSVPRRASRNLPRGLTGTYGALKAVITDAANDDPFEIYDAQIEVIDVATRRRGGI